MKTVYSPTGQPIELPEEQAQQLLAQGKVGLPKGQDVHVEKPGGGVALVKSEELPAAFADGARLASPQAIKAAQLKAEYGSLPQKAATVAQGLVSGPTLGLSDEALKGLGVPGVAEREEANPGLYAGSSLVGAGAAALLGDEAGLAGAGEEAAALGRVGSATRATTELLGAPTRAVMGAGRAVESAVGGLLGADEGGSVVAQLAKRALAKGAGAAVEGSVYGIADQIHEDVLGDHELNAEKLYASGLHGAFLGLGLGAGLSAAGEIGSAVLGRATPTLGGMAEDQAVRAINPRKAFTKEMGRLPGGAEGVGRRLLDEGTIRAGDTIEEIAPRVAAAQEKAGAKVGQILDAADAAHYEGPSVQAIRDRIAREVLPDLEKLPGLNAPAIAKVQRALDDLDAFAGIPSEAEAAARGVDRAVMLEGKRLTFRQMQDFRGALGKSIEWRVSPLGPIDKANETMKDVYHVLEGELESQGEKAASKMGGSFLDEYREAKLAYRQLTVADKAAQDAIVARQANRVASPSDMITGAAGLAGGLAEGHGLGGLLHGGLTGLAAGMLHHAVRERGNATAAVLLDKLAILRGVERAARAMDREVDRGVAGLVGEERAATHVRELPSSTKNPYREHAEAAIQAATAPDVHAAKIADATGPLAGHAPKIAQAFRTAAMRAVQYLAAQAPHRNPPPSITPQLDEPRISRGDEAKFLLVAHAVHDPASVLDDLAHGNATRAQVEAIKAVYPKLYGELQQKLQAKLANRSKPLEWEQRKQLAILFGPAAGPMFAPAFVARMQADFANPGGGQGSPKTSRGGGAPKRKLDGFSDHKRLAGS